MRAGADTWGKGLARNAAGGLRESRGGECAFGQVSAQRGRDGERYGHARGYSAGLPARRVLSSYHLTGVCVLHELLSDQQFPVSIRWQPVRRGVTRAICSAVAGHCVCNSFYRVCVTAFTVNARCLEQTGLRREEPAEMEFHRVYLESVIRGGAAA